MTVRESGLERDADVCPNKLYFLRQTAHSHFRACDSVSQRGLGCATFRSTAPRVVDRRLRLRASKHRPAGHPKREFTLALLLGGPTLTRVERRSECFRRVPVLNDVPVCHALLLIGTADGWFDDQRSRIRCAQRSASSR